MSMRERLFGQLSSMAPAHLEIVDESHMHSRGVETHYKAVVVCEEFAGLSVVKRHQQVYACLGDLMRQIHALALHTYSPDEWAKHSSAPLSPACRGGSKHDR